MRTLLLVYLVCCLIASIERLHQWKREYEPLESFYRGVTQEEPAFAFRTTYTITVLTQIILSPIYLGYKIYFWFTKGANDGI